jgi:hypothetical protein
MADRKKFECWAYEQDLRLSRLSNDERYESFETEWAWRAWAQASGAADTDRHGTNEHSVSVPVPAAPTSTTPAAQADKEQTPCKRCGGSKVVPDGEIGFYSDGVTPFDNGPIKCFKDCPVCATTQAPAPAAPVLSDEQILQIAMKTDDIYLAAPRPRSAWNCYFARAILSATHVPEGGKKE